jgi:hypothetical protein
MELPNAWRRSVLARFEYKLTTQVGENQCLNTYSRSMVQMYIG